MKRITHSAIPLLWSLLLMAAPISGAVADVYKTVDKDGNVVYTDQPPEPGARPMELPGLSVVEFYRPPSAAAGAEADAEGEQEEVTDIRELRKGYRDFRITSPQPEEHITGTENRLTISWDSRYALQPGMTVQLFLDGEPLPPTRSGTVVVEEVYRGEHIVSGKIVDSRNRTVADASPVVFFMRQFSVNFPNAAQGGG